MRELAFLVADLWMVAVGLVCGWILLRRYRNYLLGLEWVIVGSSGVNFLVWSFLGADDTSPLYDLAYFLDAFSRSVGITLILIAGMLRVTHRYTPSRTVDVSLFALGIAAGLYLRQFADGQLHVGPALFYVAANLLTAGFLVYVALLLRRIDRPGLAVATLLATAAGVAIALTYDFFPLPFDDADRTIFYTAALATWGTQGFVYFLAYRALHDENVASDARRRRTSERALRGSPR